MTGDVEKTYKERLVEAQMINARLTMQNQKLWKELDTSRKNLKKAQELCLELALEYNEKNREVTLAQEADAI